METTYLLIILAGVVLALLLQGVASVRLASTVKRLSTRLEDLSKDVQNNIRPLSSNLVELISTVKTVVEGVQTMQGHLSATSEVIHKRAVDLDGLVGEATKTARHQVAKMQEVLDTTSRKLEETFDTVQRGIVAPVSEATAVLRALRVGLNFFFRGGKRPSPQSHLDEEMFI